MGRLRGVFLAALGAEETEIEASFCLAINTAKKQKSVSLERRAEATYAEYRRQKQAGKEDVESDYRFGNFFAAPSIRWRVSITAGTDQREAQPNTAVQ